MSHPRTPVSARPVQRSFIIWPNPVIQTAWRAVFTLANGEEEQCRHNHSREDLAAKCGKRSVRKGNLWE